MLTLPPGGALAPASDQAGGSAVQPAAAQALSPATTTAVQADAAALPDANLLAPLTVETTAVLTVFAEEPAPAAGQDLLVDLLALP